MERYIVTASLCWSQPHSQTPRDKDVSLGVCEWGCDQHKLAVTIPLFHCSLPAALPPSTAPHRRWGGGHWVPPRSPQKARGRPLGTSPAPPQKVRGRPPGTSPPSTEGAGAATGYLPRPPTEGVAVEKTLLVL